MILILISPFLQVKRAIDGDPSIKLIFLCSPGNPTGTAIPLSAIREILDYQNFQGIVIVDEAYIDFAGSDASAVSLIEEYANICVMQTLSKSFGLAAIRSVSCQVRSIIYSPIIYGTVWVLHLRSPH